jgi:ATP-dependent Lon protease
VTVPSCFVHNGTGKLGLVGYWDVVAFDEFAGKQKRVDKALVDIMKNYMANKSFSRGVETLGAEASMVFVGNTDRTVPYMLKHSDLFAPCPRSSTTRHSWIVSTATSRLGSRCDPRRCSPDGYGFVVDYLAEILRALRNHDFSDRYKAHFKLSDDISTRDRDGINKTFSGLMKVIYPHGDASAEEIEALLRLAIEGRKRVKDQLLRIDSTYPAVRFTYTDQQGNEHEVRTLEEDEYPAAYHQYHGGSRSRREFRQPHPCMQRIPQPPR